MKLQKLVYMAFGAWLRDHDEPFIAENPQVWQYGPVFDSLYHGLKKHKSNKITDISEVTGNDGHIQDEAIKSLIARIYEKYKDVSASNLSTITHLPGSPWHQIATANDFCVPLGEEIPTEIIQKYFRETADMAV